MSDTADAFCLLFGAGMALLAWRYARLEAERRMTKPIDDVMYELGVAIAGAEDRILELERREERLRKVSEFNASKFCISARVVGKSVPCHQPPSKGPSIPENWNWLA